MVDASAPFIAPDVDYPDEDEERELLLSAIGLYRDIATKTLAPDLVAFRPAYALWSDGAEKSRFLRLPPDTSIDASDPSHFVFPKGAALFKEFRAPDGKRLETRVIARTGEGERDFFMGAFVWDEDESDARLVRDGAQNVRGTEHDVPERQRCPTCHGGEPSRVLGLSAVQQSRSNAEPGLEALEAMGVVSPPITTRVDATVPGDDIEQAALGYLHANCGHCHNPAGSARPDTDMHLRIYPGDGKVEDTFLYQSTVSVELQNFTEPGLLRVTPANPERSALYLRMTSREMKIGMPPIASEKVDQAGVSAVRAWIEGLSP